ncbi:DUF1203 domain-containing protein [Sphingomicrobium marinum]|uniref:DUF1203 domain-containing protein n=1 Tax=Sphingomicrobium marinum TaxID=1227950 RepID=UPI00223FCF15|nr:DUF1203 domain-containing protein [Sphingomicrobium marinum]
MTYRITGIDPEPYQRFFTMSDTDLTAANAVVMTSDARVGYPCRAALDDVPPETRLVLVNHVSHEGGPYAASHAIFVSENADRADYIDRVPPALDRRILSLRAFGADGMMADACLAQRGEADRAIRALFENEAVDHIDAHNAIRGCFAARVERA